MEITQLDISCDWGGTLAGVLVKKRMTNPSTPPQKTTKIIAIHGWLDNLNSLLPLAEKLIDRHPNYEIYLFDRAGHGFSSHLPKGIEYAAPMFLRNLRRVVQVLGWEKEKYSLIGHSFGAMIALGYAAGYSSEVSCVALIEGLPGVDVPPDLFWKVHAARIDASLQFHRQTPRNFDKELTYEKALELTKSTRPGITDAAAQLLLDRSIRRDRENKLHFTRDEALKVQTLVPYHDSIIFSLLKSVRAPILYICALNPQWPRPEESIDFLQKHNPHFEMTIIDGPHHLHMTHVDQVFERVDRFLTQHLRPSSTSEIEHSKL